MITRGVVVLPMVLLPAMLLSQDVPFIFAGVGLRSEISQVAANFPNSSRVGNHIRVAVKDSREHVFEIEISGAGADRRVRISFEIPADAGRGDSGVRYPTCGDVQMAVERRYGSPTAVREYADGVMMRSERQWRRGEEQLTLQCFAGTGSRMLADAVTIARSTK